MPHSLGPSDLQGVNGGTFVAGVYTCPNCGSQQIDVNRTSDAPGTPNTVYICTNCGHEWHDKNYFNDH